MSETVNPDKAPAGQQEIDQQYITHAEAEQLEQNILNQVRSYVDKGRVRAGALPKLPELPAISLELHLCRYDKEPL